MLSGPLVLDGLKIYFSVLAATDGLHQELISTWGYKTGIRMETL